MLPSLAQSMKALLLMLLSFPLCLTSLAQITFRSGDIPSQAGKDFWRAYADTSGRSVSQLLGHKGGPQRWDFSAPQASGEDIQRMDIVPRTDAGHGDDFSQAAYAERVTRASDGCQTWSYYQVITDTGRFYSGFYDACKSPQAGIVFDAPTLELPEDITFGRSWQREVDWQDTIDTGFGVLTVAIHFVNRSEVDAYGTVVLPGIGEVPALRVNEVNSYETTDLTFGFPIDNRVFRSFYWLVPGIGKAVHIISAPDSSAPPENLATAKSVLRVFESSAFVKPRSVKDLRIAIKGKEVFLSWTKEAAAQAYEVHSTDAMNDAPVWSRLTTTTDTFFFAPLPVGSAAKFFCVLWVP